MNSLQCKAHPYSLPAQRLGYDPSLLIKLPTKDRTSLNALSHAWLFSCALLAYPVGYAAWIIEHSLLLSIASSLFVFLLVLSLLRLVNAGGGTAPTEPLPESYHPSLLPIFLIGGLALILSGPAQLPLAGPSVEAMVKEHRTTLIQIHNESFEKLVVLSPALLARTTYFEAIGAYEKIRWLRAADLIELSTIRRNMQVNSALSQFSTYHPALHKKGLFMEPLERPSDLQELPRRQQ